MEIIDIGVNLMSSQFHDRDKIVLEAKEAGVGMIITGSDLKSSKEAADYVKDKKGIYATAGIHPHDAKDCDEHTLHYLAEIHKQYNVVAVGECGLDYNRMYSPKDVQLEIFEKQVILAESLGKPLFLHERDASKDMVSLLRKYPEAAQRAVIHCFTGTKEEAVKYLACGCMIGITGWVMDKRRNQDLLEALEVIPVDRLMVETDAPYLLPRGIKGLKSPNHPKNIHYIIDALAKVKKYDIVVIKEILYKNTIQFFSLR